MGAQARSMRFFIDECLSPVLARRLNETGLHDAVHPRDRGRLQDPDHEIVQDCIIDDRIIVTGNGRDFRVLLEHETLHPGLIILPAVTRDETWRLLELAISSLEGSTATRSEDKLVNHVLDVDRSGTCRLMPLPKS
jgi:predicted nuclease of predicted toxin-antitoxin system